MKIVVRDADLLDAGVIFGTGFAPFRGGPMQYARDRGVDEVVLESLSAMATEFADGGGDRFTPHSGLGRTARSGDTVTSSHFGHPQTVRRFTIAKNRGTGF